MGNLLIQEYYVFFDATPMDEHGHHYIQVGIGKQNADDIIANDYDKKIDKDENDDMSTGSLDGHTGIVPEQLPDAVSASPALAITIILLILLLVVIGGLIYYKRKKARLNYKYAEQEGANARLASVSADGMEQDPRAESNFSDFTPPNRTGIQ